MKIASASTTAELSRHCALARATCPRNVPYGPASGSRCSGTWLAISPAGDRGHESGKPALANRLMQNGQSVFPEMGRDVHRAHPWKGRRDWSLSAFEWQGADHYAIVIDYQSQLIVCAGPAGQFRVLILRGNFV